MDEMKRRRFTLIKNDEDEVDELIRAHRMKIIRRVLVAVVLVIALAVGIYLWLKYKGYDSYVVVEEKKLDTITESTFYEYAEGLLKVSKSGAIYTDIDGDLKWNQGFEMNHPIVDICDNYIVVGAKGGRILYCFNDNGTCYKLEVEDEISQVEVSGTGIVAVLSRNKNSNYINLYDAKGQKLVQGEMHLENSGYPLSIALSSDALKLAVALVDVNSGEASSTVNFYNFGTVGQNEIDNCVSTYTYEGVVIPRLEYFGKDNCVAVGDDRLIFYQGRQKPEEKKSVTFSSRIKGVFFSTEYVGLTFDDTQNEKAAEKQKSKSTSSGDVSSSGSGIHQVMVYDYRGKEIMDEDFTMDYVKAEIVNENEVVILKESEISIFSLKGGAMKYCGKLEDEILKVQEGKAGNEYYIIYKEKMSKIRLK